MNPPPTFPTLQIQIAADDWHNIGVILKSASSGKRPGSIEKVMAKILFATLFEHPSQ